MTDSSQIKLNDFWPYQVVVLADLVSRHTNSTLKQFGHLNLSQWRVLAAIGDQPGLSAAEVVVMTPMDKGIVSRATASLVKDGYIRKKSDPSDKRRAELFLTIKGEKYYAQVSRALNQSLNQLDVPEQLNPVLHRQIANMREL